MQRGARSMTADVDQVQRETAVAYAMVAKSVASETSGGKEPPVDAHVGVVQGLRKQGPDIVRRFIEFRVQRFLLLDDFRVPKLVA